MTAFFDGLRGRIDDAAVSWETMQALEEALVFPCLRASVMPRFPAEVAAAIDAAILRFGVTTLPPNAPPADFETDDEHRARLLNLESALHGAFHAAGSVEGGVDGPLLWLDRATLYVAQDRLEAAAAGAAPVGTPASTAPGAGPAAMPEWERRGGLQVDTYQGADRCVVSFDFPRGSAWNIKGRANPKEYGRCGKRGPRVLVGPDGASRHFCAAHERNALAGYIDASGTQIPALDRRNYQRLGGSPPYVGTWAPKARG